MRIPWEGLWLRPHNAAQRSVQTLWGVLGLIMLAQDFAGCAGFCFSHAKREKKLKTEHCTERILSLFFKDIS